MSNVEDEGKKKLELAGVGSTSNNVSANLNEVGRRWTPSIDFGRGKAGTDVGAGADAEVGADDPEEGTEAGVVLSEGHDEDDAEVHRDSAGCAGRTRTREV